MLLTVNGKTQELGSVATVSELLKTLDLDPRRVVVELNERIVRRHEVEETALAEGDTVEILRFVGGG